jgi:hypothetical protein
MGTTWRIAGNHERKIKIEFRENGFFVNGLSISGEVPDGKGAVRFSKNRTGWKDHHWPVDSGEE